MSGAHELPVPQGVRCGDAPVYLLGLLDESLAGVFLEHARCCAVCNDELEALAPAVDVLPATVPLVPAPSDVKQRVMSIVRAQSCTGAPERGQTPRLGWPISGGWPIFRGWPLHVRAALVLGGAALVVLGVLMGGLLSPSSARTGGATRGVVADVTLAGARAELRQRQGRAWLAVSGMPRPAHGDVYEVWVQAPGAPAPNPTGDLFTPDRLGEGTVAVPRNLRAGSEVLVTQEPAGGTLRPTGPPMIVARVL